LNHSGSKGIVESDRILHEVRRHIQSRILLGVSYGELGPDDSFLETGVLNSTGVMELVAFLEEHFGIVLADEEITPENLDSMNAIRDFLLRKLSAPDSVNE
jgi:acyl carrier protein